MKPVKLIKILIHTKEDGETHWAKGKPAKETLCGKRLHPISMVYTPKLPVICSECEFLAETMTFSLSGEIIAESY